MLWTEKHEPALESGLVVSKKRIQEVKDFFLSAGRRVLVLTGPPGSGKATTLRCICNELNLEVVEWSTPRPQQGRGPNAIYSDSIADSFLRFLAQADRYTGIGQTSSPAAPNVRRRRVTLVREFPSTLLGSNPSLAARFLERFTQVLNEGAVQRAVLCFNDGTWEERRIMLRLFSQVQPSVWGQIKFDEVAKTFVQRALEGIFRAEGLPAAPLHSQAIAAECGGDLRHAINALQLGFAGLKPSSSAAPASSQTAGQRGGGKARGRGAAAGGAAGSKSRASRGSKNACSMPSGGGFQPAAPDSHGLREATLGLFHALGRLLYNKRRPPQATSTGSIPQENSDEVQQNGGASQTSSNPSQQQAAPPAKRRRKASEQDTDPRQLPPELMRPKAQRPSLYFVPEEVLESANTEPEIVVDWLFTNAPRFYGDVEDLAEFASTMAEVDAWSRSHYRVSKDVLGAESASLATSVQARALLDANLHPVPPGHGGTGVSGEGASFNMVKPAYLDVSRLRQRRLESINLGLERLGHEKLGAVSASKRVLCQILPFSHLLLFHSKGRHRGLSSLSHFMMKQVMDTNKFEGQFTKPSSTEADGVPSASPQELAASQPSSMPLADDPIESFD